MEKEKLNIHFSGNLADKKIFEFLSQQFELNLIEITSEELKNNKLNLNEKIKTIDLIIFTGGEDVSPEWYSEPIGKFTHVNNKRDDLEFSLLYAENVSSLTMYNIPKLGICRGAQLLTVYNGGKLIQHTTGHNNNEQLIECNIKSRCKLIQVSSDHHQMMYPFNLKEDKYQLLGWSKNFQSTTYLNGKNEEIKLTNDFLEPEIVFYPIKNSLCIQSHPEWCIGSEGSNFCLDLINKYLLKNKNLSFIDKPEGLPKIGNFIGEMAFCNKGDLYKFNGEDFVKSEDFINFKKTNIKYAVPSNNETLSTIIYPPEFDSWQDYTHQSVKNNHNIPL